MTSSDGTPQKAREKCYNPSCDEDVDWGAGISEAYCSDQCAVEAREGLNAQ